MREKLSLSHRLLIDRIFRNSNFDSFYHYFPFIYALSENAGKVEVESERDNLILWSDSDELYTLPANLQIPLVKKIFVSTFKFPHWFSTLLDVNYIYEISEALNRLRHNYSLFLKSENPTYKSISEKDAKEVIEKWYHSREKGETIFDFDYTYYLSTNFSLFSDLKARGVYLNSEPVAFTLFGKLDNSTAIHLILKADLTKTYLSDYVRYKTYEEMEKEDFILVNDGGDLGKENLRKYKMKLYPKYIIPLWSLSFE